MAAKIPWLPSQKASRAAKNIVEDIYQYKLMMADRGFNSESIELTLQGWQDINKTLKKCRKVAPLRDMKLEPIHHITIHGLSLFVKEKPTKYYNEPQMI